MKLSEIIKENNNSNRKIDEFVKKVKEFDEIYGNNMVKVVYDFNSIVVLSMDITSWHKGLHIQLCRQFGVKLAEVNITRRIRHNFDRTNFRYHYVAKDDDDFETVEWNEVNL